MATGYGTVPPRLICMQKKPMTRNEAESRAASHYDCSICTDRVRLQPYPCSADPTHWHTGHMTVRNEP